MKNISSEVFGTQKPNASFELLKIFAMSMFVLYHVALIVPKTDSSILQIVKYTSRMGWIGADILLALAGFLLYQSMKERLISYRYLILKKLLRAALPYYLFLILYLHTGSWFFDYIGLGWELKEGYELALFGFFVNWLLAFRGMTGVALEGMYSLSIGVQLVVISSLILKYVKNKKTLIIFFLILEVIVIFIRLFFDQTNIWQFYFITFTRMDAFIMGVIISIIRTDYLPDLSWNVISKKLFYLSSFFLLVVAAVTKGLSMWHHLTPKISGPFIAFFSISLVLVAYEYSYQGTFKNVVWNLGKSTYAVYLIKLPAVYFVVLFLNRLEISNSYVHGLLPYALSILLCFFLSLVWWFAVEKRIISMIFSSGKKWKLYFSKR